MTNYLKEICYDNKEERSYEKMKIYHILIWVILLILVIVLSNSITNNIYCGKENKFDNNLLSIMIETGEASGQYEKSNNSLWPTGDYVFNAELSRCENGSTLNWIDAKKLWSIQET